MRGRRMRVLAGNGRARPSPVARVVGAFVVVFGLTACYEGYRLDGDAHAEVPDASSDDSTSGEALDAPRHDSTADDAPICPGNVAGRLERLPNDVSVFEECGAYFDLHHRMRSDETVVLRLAIIPFADIVTIVELMGGFPSSLYFMRDGFVTHDYRVPGVIPYNPSGWNIVEWTTDTTNCRTTYEVNGVATPGYLPYGYCNPDPTLNGVRVITTHEHAGPHAGTTAWIDGVSVAIRSPRGETTVFADYFPTAGHIVDQWADCAVGFMRLVAEVPPVPLDDPIGCGAR